MLLPFDSLKIVDFMSRCPRVLLLRRMLLLLRSASGSKPLDFPVHHHERRAFAAIILRSCECEFCVRDLQTQ
jgi:hypothetical protein